MGLFMRITYLTFVCLLLLGVALTETPDPRPVIGIYTQDA